MKTSDNRWNMPPQTLTTEWSTFDRQHEATLAAAGIAAEHIGDLGMSRAKDDAILETARQRKAVVITLDADFHHLLAASHATLPSVVRVRIEGLKGDQLAAILAQVVAIASAELDTGAVASVTTNRVRVRTLPIGRTPGLQGRSKPNNGC